MWAARHVQSCFYQYCNKSFIFAVCDTYLFLYTKPFSNDTIFFCVFLGEGFDYLDAPVYRVTGADVPMPYAQTLEQFALPQRHNIVNTVKKCLNIQ